MAVVIRLRQQGKNNRRSFRLVVTDARARRDGKYLEKLGYYDPHLEEALIIDSQRVQYWLEQGALISERAKSLVLKKAPEVIQYFKEKKQAKKIKEKKAVKKSSKK